MAKKKKFRWSSLITPTAFQQTQRNLWIAVGAMVVVMFGLLAYLGYLLLIPPEVTLGGRPADEVIMDPMESRPRPTVPDGADLVMLNHLIVWYEENNALAGWLRIDGTKIDYPVIFTPEDEDAYLRKNFNGKFSMEGTLFISGDCTILPESDNIIIYGHNMKRGTMFHDLLNYKKKSYWEEHPIIEYSTLYEERQYEIVAAFYDRVYYTYERSFKFYEFINYDTVDEFKDAVLYFKNKSEYDTGVEPVYGDRFLTLVTCSYHERYGRFVVVAREITENTDQDR